MRKFDPWPVFFRREWKRNWPFLVGFAITGTVITKFSLGLTGNPLFFICLFCFCNFGFTKSEFQNHNRRFCLWPIFTIDNLQRKMPRIHLLFRGTRGISPIFKTLRSQIYISRSPYVCVWNTKVTKYVTMYKWDF